MSLKITDHLFYGPFKIADTVLRPNHTLAVFAIVSREGKPWDPIFRLIDVDASEVGGVIFAEHSRAQQWRDDAAGGNLGVYLLDLPGADPTHRRQIAAEIRAALQPPTGIIPIHAI